MSWAEWADDVEIEPSIYASDFSRLGEQLEALARRRARGSSTSTSATGTSSRRSRSGRSSLASISPLVRGWGARLDCHLMVARAGEALRGDREGRRRQRDLPRRGLRRACAGGRARHASLGLGVGVAFNPETAVEDAVAAADGVDLVLCMSIHPGYSGQAFMPEALERIARAALRCCPPSVRVQVDGGINRETARAARDAGADLLVAGSAVFWNDDPGFRVPRARRAVTETRVPELLEIREADGAFARIEEWLAGHGFFGRVRTSSSRTSTSATGSRSRSGATPRRRRPSRVPRSRLRRAGSSRQRPCSQSCQARLEIGAWERTWTAASTAPRSRRSAPRSRAATSTR